LLSATRAVQFAKLAGNAELNLPSAQSLSARIRPWWASMIERYIGNPMPMPVSLVVKKLSRRR